MVDMREEQLDEIEALKSIYDSDFTDITQNPPCFMIKLTITSEIQLSGPVSLKITFPPDYPDVVPAIEIPMRSRVLSSDDCQALTINLQEVAETSIGMPMVFTLVDAAQQWIVDNVQAQVDIAEEHPETDDAGIASVSEKLLVQPQISGGRWDFVIGLVGKPSAGKSTFFNAATTLDLAQTGAHPFTTIEPNIGKAFYFISCPCQDLDHRCHAAYGHNFHGDRHIPVLLKDVAGLVPGAWEGKGRGNRFLNDLLDADVLIHVLDISGKTNEKGEQTTEYDPSKDVQWIQEELHQWIYQNILNKWDSISRRPQKLIDMFTGYHANKAVIYSALQMANIGDNELSKLATWEDSVLHRVVSSFLKIRFPILVVMNKADTDTAEGNICKLQQTHPDMASIPVSARSESQLQQLQKAGVIKYDYGSQSFSIPEKSHLDPATDLRLQEIQEKVLNRFDSTNVHSALCEAVKMKEPTYAFPVVCLDTFKAIQKNQGLGHKEPEILRDCVSLKPQTRVSELYQCLLHYPISLLSGDFVRAETVNKDGKKRPVRKEDVIDGNNCILKIMTNKRGGAS